VRLGIAPNQLRSELEAGVQTAARGFTSGRSAGTPATFTSPRTSIR
jgi:hypothetical protein